MDPGFIFDDLIKEGVFRGAEAIRDLSLQPLFRQDATRYPVTTYGGQLLGSLGDIAAKGYTKVHHFFDQASSHGPSKGMTVSTPGPVVSESVPAPRQQKPKPRPQGKKKPRGRPAQDVFVEETSQNGRIARQANRNGNQKRKPRMNWKQGKTK
jgi:hypothetical protein